MLWPTCIYTVTKASLDWHGTPEFIPSLLYNQRISKVSQIQKGVKQDYEMFNHW